MFYEKIRVPGLPGEEDVTDGSVENYDFDWGQPLDTEPLDDALTDDERTEAQHTE